MDFDPRDYCDERAPRDRDRDECDRDRDHDGVSAQTTPGASTPFERLMNHKFTPAYNGKLPDLTAAFHQWQTARNDKQLKAAAYKAQLIWAQKLPKIPLDQMLPLDPSAIISDQVTSLTGVGGRGNGDVHRWDKLTCWGRFSGCAAMGCSSIGGAPGC